jgi:protein gp37
MGDQTGIEWTDATWNPVSGCTKRSQGCKNCYAEALFPRPYPGRKFTDIRVHPGRLGQPLKWRKPRRVFVNSMSDLFHESIPFEFIDKVFAVMALAPRHTFQVLTKRHERMEEYLARPNREKWIKGVAWEMLGHLPKYRHENLFARPWPLPNLWMGVSVEDQENANERVPYLLRSPAAVRFLSCEPLLGAIDLRSLQLDNETTIDAMTGCHSGKASRAAPLPPILPAIDWVIVGGESGHKARPMHPEWARALRDQCKPNGVPLAEFFFKQWGSWAPGENNAGPATRTEQVARWFGGEWHVGTLTPKQSVATHRYDEPDVYRLGKKHAGRMLDGRVWDEFPRSAA